MYRTHLGGELNKKHIGQAVQLSGWVHARRDHGNLIFIDLRDKWGITQITFDPSKNKEAFAAAAKLKDEYVITVTGTVAARPDDMINDKLATGEIEVEATALTVLSQADTLPFPLASDQEINEELRLKYRFLDLRRPAAQQIMATRDAFITHIREYMHKLEFTEVQTPILANSSPEGARDFLVPSRLHPGQFYALPQAPQQFKQLLMAAGLDRYFQIAPCFRDEDPRADRHLGVFYQLDMEMSFVTQEDIFDVIEPLMIELTKKFSNKKIITQPFPRIPWQEAMDKYGTDKPDLRYDLAMQDVSDLFRGTEFKVFADALASGGGIHALAVPSGAAFTRATIDNLTAVAKANGAPGLVYIIYQDKPTSPILKFLAEDTPDKIRQVTGAKKGDAVFFTAGPWRAACRALGAVRTAVAAKQDLADDAKAAWCWVTDFPMYEKNEETGQIDFSHNPFSMPQGGADALAAADPTTILGFQYDLALNGLEISSGAIRNHDPNIMYKAFALAGYSPAEVDDKFGGMIRAFKFGTPPHGGFAPGIDRLFMVLLDLPSIRDVYAFPKNGRGQDLLMNTPTPVSKKQLKDLHIKLDLDNDDD